MNKFPLLLLVAALSFGFVGCAPSLEKDWGLREEGDGVVSRLAIDIEDHSREAYCVTIVYCGREGTARVSYEVYQQLAIGQNVKLKLACAIYKNENDKKGERFCDATYWWRIPGVTDGGRIIIFKLS